MFALLLSLAHADPPPSPAPAPVAAADDEPALRTRAIELHKSAKKLGKDSPTWAEADAAYAAWFERYAGSPYATDMHYAYAELLYATKDFERAYEHYLLVVNADPNGAHAKFCAESAIFAADEMVKREGPSRVAAVGPSAPVPLTTWDRKLVDALDLYARLWPESPKTRNILYKAGYLLFERNQFAGAAERLRVVIAREPATKEAEQAANIVLDSFALAEDWDNLALNARAFLDVPGLGAPGFRVELAGIYENARMKQIESALGRSGDKRAAAAAYLAFAEELPASTLGELALHDAEALFRDVGDDETAGRCHALLVQRFPASKYLK